MLLKLQVVEVENRSVAGSGSSIVGSYASRATNLGFGWKKSLISTLYSGTPTLKQEY